MLPPDLMDQVRGRLRLLAALLFCGFAFDPLFYILKWIVLEVRHTEIPADFIAKGYFQLAYLAAAFASAALWWIARNPRISPSRLHNIGLGYEILVCFVIALTSNLEYYLSYHVVPNMDWVPSIVILFPLVLPGPPRRMLAAAATAAAMSPVASFCLMSRARFVALPTTMSARFFTPPSRWDLPTWGRAWCTASGARWPGRGSWAAISWEICWAGAGWVRSIGRPTGCWPDRPPSS